MIAVILGLAALAALAASGRRAGATSAVDEVQAVVDEVDGAAPKPSAPKPSAQKPSAPKPSAQKPSAPKPSAPKPSAPKPSAPVGTPENPLVLPAMVVDVDAGSSSVPPGYDPRKARASAKQMADHLKVKKYSYSRKSLSVWQAYAGIPHDGKYGPNTEGALRFYGAGAPPAMFNPAGKRPYYVQPGGAK